MKSQSLQWLLYSLIVGGRLDGAEASSATNDGDIINAYTTTVKTVQRTHMQALSNMQLRFGYVIPKISCSNKIL